MHKEIISKQPRESIGKQSSNEQCNGGHNINRQGIDKLYLIKCNDIIKCNQRMEKQNYSNQ